MVQYIKNNNYLNQQKSRIWGNIFIGDTKLILRCNNKKSASSGNFEGKVISKNANNISLRRLDNNRIENIIFSELLQNEIKIVRKIDIKSGGDVKC